jgi:hypothetical protein
LLKGWLMIVAAFDSAMPVMPEKKDCGQWYWFTTAAFFQYGAPPCGRWKAVPIGEGDGQDVNTEADWQRLTAKFEARHAVAR